jgi:hypothetical protein
MRWLMTLGEHTRPDVPVYAEDTRPDDSRAVALVDDFGSLFPVLREWHAIWGDRITGWALQVEADDVENLPAEVVQRWEDHGPEVRLDYLPGGYINVSDYRDDRTLAAIAARTSVLIRS